MSMPLCELAALKIANRFIQRADYLRKLPGRGPVHLSRTPARVTRDARDAPPKDRARELGRRIRILASRVTDRQVEKLATAVYEGAYGALAARTSLVPAFKAFEVLNDYVGTLVR
jgi:hypothetical protein